MNKLGQYGSDDCESGSIFRRCRGGGVKFEKIFIFPAVDKKNEKKTALKKRVFYSNGRWSRKFCGKIDYPIELKTNISSALYSINLVKFTVKSSYL